MGASLTLPGTDLFIGGAFVPATGGAADDVVNPATEDLLVRVGRGAAADADKAIAAARTAMDEGPWAHATGKERGDYLRRLHAALERRKPQLMATLIAEVGTIPAATESHQVGLPLEHLAYWAEAADRPDYVPQQPILSTRKDGTSWLGNWLVRREPVGVVTAITAYNFPLFLTIQKVGPALAAGNTVVLKPSEYTPLTAFILAEAVAEADLPPGVLNVVTGGAEVGQLLTTDARVDLVSFTGSDVVGAAIMAQAAPTLKRVVLELGGKSVLILRHDCDMDASVEQGIRSFTFNAGQGCALTTRHLVHSSRMAEYLDAVASRVGGMKVGDPTEPGVHMGPLIRPVAVERTERYVAGAVESGATVVTGGHRPPHLTKGYFYEPTMLANVDNAWPVAQDEIFGPVGVAIGFESDDEAAALANASRYGLDGTIMSADAGGAFQLACRVRTGGMSINGGAGTMNPAVPFGGYKRSGIGRENGEAGLDEYTQLKTIKYHAG
jgi:aldehyde dehydrogenase (NAD+)